MVVPPVSFIVSVLYHRHPLKNYKKCSIFYFFKIGIMHKVFASKLYNITLKRRRLLGVATW